MKRFFVMTALVLFALPLISIAQHRKITGKGEEYHHAMYLNFKHSAEEAEALNAQLALPYELNIEIARQHIDEIQNNLENARIQHAMVHKTYGEQQATMIAENHEILFDAHNKAIEACSVLKKEIAKGKPNLQVLLDQSAIVYRQSLKAATEHMDGMKKLGIPPMKVSS